MRQAHPSFFASSCGGHRVARERPVSEKARAMVRAYACRPVSAASRLSGGPCGSTPSGFGLVLFGRCVQPCEGADEGQRLGAGLGGRRGRMIHRHRGGIEGMFGQRRVARRVGQPSATFGLPCTAVALLYYIGVYARAIPLRADASHRRALSLFIPYNGNTSLLVCHGEGKCGKV